jgi:hypothetical protein
MLPERVPVDAALSKDPATQKSRSCTSKNQQIDRIWGSRARATTSSGWLSRKLLEKIGAWPGSQIRSHRFRAARQLVKLRVSAARGRSANSDRLTRLAIRIARISSSTSMASEIVAWSCANPRAVLIAATQAPVSHRLPELAMAPANEQAQVRFRVALGERRHLIARLGIRNLRDLTPLDADPSCAR